VVRGLTTAVIEKKKEIEERRPSRKVNGSCTSSNETSVREEGDLLLRWDGTIMISYVILGPNGEAAQTGRGGGEEREGREGTARLRYQGKGRGLSWQKAPTV